MTGNAQNSICNTVIYKTAKDACCEAKLYFKIVGQWNAVFKRCKECEND